MRHLLFVFCLIITALGVDGKGSYASGVPRRVEITARRFTYVPDVVTLKKGETVLLVLETADVAHGLRIRELGLDLKTSKNKPAEMVFTPRKTGDFVGHCSVFCGAKHGTMKITFHIVE